MVVAGTAASLEFGLNEALLLGFYGLGGACVPLHAPLAPRLRRDDSGLRVVEAQRPGSWRFVNLAQGRHHALTGLLDGTTVRRWGRGE